MRNYKKLRKTFFYLGVNNLGNVLINLIKGLSLFFLSDLDEETQIALALSASMAPPPPPDPNNKKSVKGKGKKNKG